MTNLFHRLATPLLPTTGRSRHLTVRESQPPHQPATAMSTQGMSSLQKV